MAWDGVAVLEIVVGREGLYLKRNTGLVPLGSLRVGRNVTLEDDTLRTGGGASKVGSAIGAVTIDAGTDYWPTLSTQRNVVVCSDGSIRKDDGSGGSWTTLKSGLTVTSYVPTFALGGREALGRSAKLFYADRVNTVQVLNADASGTLDLTNPPADWTGTNQPGVLFPHGRWLWGAGNANDPKRLYRSTGEDHEDFTSFIYTLSIAGEFERLAAGLSYKGGALVFGYPEGVWFIDTSDPVETNWRPVKVGRPGAAGPANVVAVEDDVLWISPDGSWHLISATQATGSARAEDIGYRKLGSYMADRINLARLSTAPLIYYAHKQLAMLGCASGGQTTKNVRLDFDVRRRTDVGERWVAWDRDRNEALWLRKKNEVLIPAFGDAAGQVWEMDQPDRNKDGTAYTAEWEVNAVDAGAALFQQPGRKTNGRFIQVTYDPRQATTLTLDILRDGDAKQTITFALGASAGVLPQTLPFTLGGVQTLTASRRKRLLGQAVRWGVKGYTSGINADASVAEIALGLELAG